MSMVYRYNNYSSWIAAKQASRTQKRSVAVTNIGLYSGWASIAICRAGTYVESITAFFRSPTAFTLTAPVALTGFKEACSHVGLALGSAACMAEMAVTCFLFGKDAHHFRQLGKHLEAHSRNHAAYSRYISDLKDAAHEAKEPNDGNPRRGARDRAGPSQLPGADIGETPSPSAVTVAEDLDVLAKSFFEYEVAQVEHPEATSTFERSLVMFLRDGPFQGGAVGCNLASLWQGFKVSDLLHIATVPVNAVATAICGAGFSVACGIFHIVGGVLARSEGLQKLAAAIRAKKAIDEAILHIEEVKEKQIAGVDNAVKVGAALLQHAAKNEERAQNSARAQIFVGKWRIGYGTTAIGIAAATLTFFLVVGGLSSGGLLFAFAGAAVLAGWVGYAAHRNRQDANKLKDATAAVAGEPPGMTLEKAIADAVDYLDRTDGIGKNNRDGRRIIKRALIQIGMHKSDFWALRFCNAAAKPMVVDTLKVLIHNHIDGDGARRPFMSQPEKEVTVSQSATA